MHSFLVRCRGLGGIGGCWGWGEDCVGWFGFWRHGVACALHTSGAGVEVLVLGVMVVLVVVVVVVVVLLLEVGALVMVVIEVVEGVVVVGLVVVESMELLTSLKKRLVVLP